MMKKIMFYVLLIASLVACKSNKLSDGEAKELLSDTARFHTALDQLTDVIVHDIFSPPVASRIYVYPMVAAYEVLQQDRDGYRSMAGQLNGLTAVPTPTDPAGLYYELAALEAFYAVSQALIFSENKITEAKANMLSELDSLGLSLAQSQKSLDYGKQVADHILAWADKDNYKQTRSDPKYTITDNPAEWKPTPPAYMEGIEPSWRNIRPLVIKTANQFRPVAPTAFDMKKGSKFYKETLEVYETGKKLSEEERLIASFWDCNPYVMNQTGHMMFATKKITPGGHWMGIANIASEASKHDLMSSVETTMLVSVALFDAFISCWDEKYRSKLIRPETVINEYIDEEWKPLLQTPPFPEHTSGHSVISTASAQVLTHLIGEDFAYTDDVELKYGLPVRKFKSFKQASAEAAISRLYGGIHYMPAIAEGVKQGELLGQYIISELKTKE